MATPHAKKIVMDLLAGTKAVTGVYGLGDIIANTDSLLQKILTTPPYSAAEMAEWAAWFASKGAIPVLGEFRRDTAQLPAVFVLRAGDGEPPRGGYLGNYVGEQEDETTDYAVASKYGSKLAEELEIHILAGGADAPAVRDVLYLIVRELLMRADLYMHQAGMTVVEWVGGRDGQMERPEYEPHIVHMASASLTYQVDVTWSEQEEIILDVDGHLQGYEDGAVIADPFISDE